MGPGALWVFSPASGLVLGQTPTRLGPWKGFGPGWKLEASSTTGKKKWGSKLACFLFFSFFFFLRFINLEKVHARGSGVWQKRKSHRLHSEHGA